MTPKFRAWDKQYKEMREVVAIDLYHETYSWILDHYREMEQSWEDEDFEGAIIMQYAGLKDKNGAEVYFNDIVEDEYGHRYEVVFEGDCLRCNGIRRIRGGYKPKNRWFNRDLKIIGNIYENPELLEVAE